MNTLDETILEQAPHFSGNSRAWEDVVAASIRGVVIEELASGQPPEPVQERIAYSVKVVREVQSHVGEIAIFYNQFDETAGSQEMYHAFTAVVPHKSRPFALYTESSRTPKLFVLPARITEGGRRQAASQSFFFSDRTENAGIQAVPQIRNLYTDPDAHFMRRHKGDHAIAIGNKAVGNLMTSLAQKEGMQRSKLLGSYLRIGEMAVRFGATIPAVPELAAEVESTALDTRTAMLISDTTAMVDSTLARETATLLDRFVSSREHLAKITSDANEKSKTGALPYVGDMRPMPYMTPADYFYERSQLNLVLDAIKAEGLEHSRRIKQYQAQLKILEAIKG